MTARQRHRDTFFEHFPGFRLALEFCRLLEAKIQKDEEIRRLRQRARRRARGVQVGLFEEAKAR